MRDDEKLAELRAAAGKAIQEFMEYQQELFWGVENVYVLHWIVAVEMTNPEMEADEQSKPGLITPDGQSASASIGLLENGKMHWR